HQKDRTAMIVQIYEIQTPYEAEACIESGVDHLGSVLLSKENWRVPALKEVIRLSQDAGTKNSLIPLFSEIDSLYRALDYYRPHYIHFCDSLTDQNGLIKDLDAFIRFQSDLKENFPEIGIIRSIPVPRKGTSPGFPSLKIAAAIEPVTDIFLTDTWLGKEPVQGFIGITGKTADWDIVRGLIHQSDIPVILAGGLSPDNVHEAIIKVQPAGADSCTLTNRTDKHGKPVRFRKDFSKVKRFVEEVRRAKKAILHKVKK
ncbi:MAG: hypothetical protein U9N82_04600, partial [Thermodesulfobacteriota bacterium]|nr:hypothetical protein [Thermodesulfobacteriota bacterium]